MATEAVTSQPVFNSHSNIGLDAPPSYDEVISQQPRPNPLNNVGNSEARLPNENSDILESDDIPAEETTENTEEKQKRNNRRHAEDCCFVCVEEDSDWMFGRLIANCCFYFAHCTESCCEGCAESIHNCCESNTAGERQVDTGSCADGCCSGSGDSSSDNCDCDCNCFD